jgi:hypothetical protein
MAFHDAIEQSPRSSGIRTPWIVDPPNGRSRCALGTGEAMPKPTFRRPERAGSGLHRV